MKTALSIVLIAIAFPATANSKVKSRKDYAAIAKKCTLEDRKPCQIVADDCNTGVGEACFVWGLNVYFAGEDAADKNEMAKGKDLLKKACTLGFKEGCTAYDTEPAHQKKLLNSKGK